ncbi:MULTISPECIES: response regulator transcription factor [Streptomyces]|uniref:response regulator transcription factor n=1 Tax=Streptomyces TaxID=1883 RepID=UPI00163B9348|nr:MULTISPECIES: response regulator transcription factor [Streptomyces]MBC2877617.1 response regulator transcription factor [Streptomyces sp. TYQ1024]UBI36149.1 response regulator transcription factor [Streptomyces mobaraensis]UKW28744.1 response regulator transcription factor [Streptomyces sp. TYQ1024]
MKGILVIEDDPQLGPALQRGLTAEGYDVELVRDGTTGLQRALTGGHAVIVLDIMLPGPNGYRICAALRAAGLTTPVLMLTAKDGEYDEAEGLDTGADDYLVKPFSSVVLLARLRALLRRGAAATAADRSVLRVGDLWADVTSRRAGRGDVEFALTPKEFAILTCLLHTPDRPVSKEEILDEVWDPAYTGGTAIVEVYISTLRKKVDAPFATHSIETVRGYGYRLTPRERF